MQQIVQNIKSGQLTLETVPPPTLQAGGVRVRTGASLISAGTEKMLMDLAQKSLVGKAQARPDLVRQVIDKAKKEGLLNTYRNVQSKMEKPMSLGYSAAGIIEQVGGDVYGFQVGDRVAIAGAGYANHAEINFVPKNLCAVIPEGVTLEEASYSTVASIALQGVRLAKPELGDNVAVIGLGLIGLITVQLLQANGCRVIGIDLDERKVNLGLELGMDAGVVSSKENTEQVVDRFTRGRGTDHTLITAATKSNGPIELAGEITRRKGQVVAVGAVGMQIPRDIYYKKELELKISMSYGPGRYDPSYEEGGVDYPYDYVRWTEQRNLEAVLDLMARKRLNVKALTTHHFDFDKALDAYAMINEGKKPYVGIVLTYDVEREQGPVVHLSKSKLGDSKRELGVGFVGAGNYAALHLLPHLKKNPRVQLQGLVTATGLNAQQKAEKFEFNYCTTDIEPLLEDGAIDALFIATRHSTHADYTIKALNAGKHVFVEKPMVVSAEQLREVEKAYKSANEQKATAVMVGLNRRFAPMVGQLIEALPAEVPKQMIYRVNSGFIPTSSWLHEKNEGGGMLVGEMCHFIDLMQFISGEQPARVFAQSLTLGRSDIADHDNVSIVITFDKGSTGTLCYSTVGNKIASKERIEVYSGGCAAVLDDFRVLEVVRDGKRSKDKSLNQDKGQVIQLKKTVSSFCANGTSPIPFEQLVAAMTVVFAAKESIVTGSSVELNMRTEAQKLNEEPSGAEH